MILYFVPVPERSMSLLPLVLTFQISRLTSGAAYVMMVMHPAFASPVR